MRGVSLRANITASALTLSAGELRRLPHHVGGRCRKHHGGPGLRLLGTLATVRYYLRIMLRAGRSFLLLLSFLSLQLSLISGGERCPVVSLFGQGSTSMAGMDMAGMDMAGMDMAGRQGDEQSDASSSHHDEQSCDDESASTTCDSMTVCAFAAVTAPASVRTTQRLTAPREPTLALRTPPTEGDAPDLPPPRLQS